MLPRRWRELLSAVAVFATGGLKALEARGRPEDRLMIEHHAGRRELMGVIIVLVALLLVLLALVAAFLRADPADWQAACASLGPVLLGMVGVAVLVGRPRRRSAA